MKQYRRIEQMQNNLNTMRYDHYMRYLQLLTYQLFKWEGLPDSVDESYLEKELHRKGYVAFYQDRNIGFIAVEGAKSGGIDHYGHSRAFTAASPSYRAKFKLVNYDDVENKDFEYGVLIKNNDLEYPTTPSLNMFALELMNISSVISTNVNAMRTPVLIKGSDNQLLSLRQLYQKWNDGTPVVFGDKGLDNNILEVLKTDAPFVADKLHTLKAGMWNELMTFLGIKNANQEKKERMITAEADSNDEQILSSGNRMLKSRQEASRIINNLYGLNTSVTYRQEILDELKGGGEDVILHNTDQNVNRTGDTV